MEKTNDDNITSLLNSNMTGKPSASNSAISPDEIDIMKILHMTIGSVGMVANLTVVIAFVNDKKFRRKIPNMFIINQVSNYNFMLFTVCII